MYPLQERKKHSTQVAKSANGLSLQPKKKPLNPALDNHLVLPRQSSRHQVWQQVDESDLIKRSASKPPPHLVKCQRPSNVMSLQSSLFLSPLLKLTTSQSYSREVEQIPSQSVALGASVARRPPRSLLRKASKTMVFSSPDRSRSQLSNLVSSLRSHLSAPKRMIQCASHLSASLPQETTASRKTTVRKDLRMSPLATRSSTLEAQRLPLTMPGAQTRAPLILDVEPSQMGRATWMTSLSTTVLKRTTLRTTSFE